MLLRVVRAMNPRKMAPVLAAMSTKPAEELTTALASKGPTNMVADAGATATDGEGDGEGARAGTAAAGIGSDGMPADGGPGTNGSAAAAGAAPAMAGTGAVINLAGSRHIWPRDEVA